MNGEKTENLTEYVIKYCICIFAEDNYETGLSSDNEHTVEYEATHIKSNTLEGLIREFNDKELYGHKFNMEDWTYYSEETDRLECSVMGKLLNKDYIDFDEPSAKDWDDFKQGKCNLTFYRFNINIEKREITTNLLDEFKQLGIEEV